MSSKQSGRRRFLKESAAMAGLAVGAVRSASAQTSPSKECEESGNGDWGPYGHRSHYVTAVRTGTNGHYGSDVRPGVPRDYGFRTPLQNSVGTITPASLHFMISHGYNPPDINPNEHRLMIHGMVNRPLIFTLDELQRLPAVTRVHFLECAGNSTASGSVFAPGLARTLPSANVQQTHGLTGCSEWTGVPLSLLLKEAGLKNGATWIIAEGAEEGMHEKSIPIGKALDDCLVAYGQNGEPVRPEQGYPLRLLVPGYEGINNVKWLRRIKVVNEPVMGMRESTKYPSLRVDGTSRWFQFELGPKSVITRPSGGQHLPTAGFYEITGLAWSGGGAIKRVEVSTDGGQNWQDAEIQGPVHRKAHTRFRLGWTWDGSETVLLSRCTDERGEMQPSVAQLGKILGVTLSLSFFQTRPDAISHFNAIQPWRVNRDGSIENALFA